MAAEQKLTIPHQLTLNERSTLNMTGVTEVISFDESTVVLRTSLGDLVIQGKELKLKTLSPEGGQLSVRGNISALAYKEPRAAGFWRRIFG